ncbi:MAG: methyltransferase domain-containing protein [Gemmatimonadetes bacterium]|nr:methyltransferase domain-containing protein [Gemmatimonadota bacterium]
MFDLTESVIAAGDHSFRLVHPRSAESLIDEAAFAEDERLPYWADIWPSSRVLADVLVRHHGDGRTALELGCGSGLVACALAVAGYRVTATDYYDAALATTANNVQVNTGVTITTRLVDWRALPSDLGRFDLVVAADVLYERPYAPLVAHALSATIAPPGTAIIADPGRVAFESFVDDLAPRGIIVDEGWDVPHVLDQQRHTIRVRVLRWAPAYRPNSGGWSAPH